MKKLINIFKFVLGIMAFGLIYIFYMLPKLRLIKKVEEQEHKK